MPGNGGTRQAMPPPHAGSRENHVVFGTLIVWRWTGFVWRRNRGANQADNRQPEEADLPHRRAEARLSLIMPPSGAQILFHPSSCTPQARMAPEQRRANFVRALDQVAVDFAAGENPYEVAGRLFDAADQVMPEDQLDAIEELRMLAATHPVQAYVRQCPLTRLALEKPRPPARSARLLDFMTRHDDARPMLDAATPVGRGILQYALDMPASSAARARVALISGAIAATARATQNARILSVGCGHARELEGVPEAERARIGTFVGVDADPVCLEVAGRHGLGGGRATTVHADPRELMADRDLTGFDLIYSASLLHYLPDRDCRRLTRDLFRRLRPGGRMLLAAALPIDAGFGYMRVFMRWSLVRRDRERIADFARGIAAADIARQVIFAEPNRCVAFLDLRRA